MDAKLNDIIWRQVLAIMIASISSLTLGIFRFWPSPTVAILTEDGHFLKITLEEASWFTILPSMTMLFCAFPVSKMMDVVGRKYVILFCSLPYIVSWILIGMESSLWTFYVARLITGIGDTIVLSALPIYVGEVSTPKVREIWGNALACAPFIGGLLMNIVGGYFDIRMTACILISLPLLFLLTFPFMPETPYHYLMKGRTEDAKKSLRWLRGKEDVDEEFERINEGVKQQKTKSGTVMDVLTIKANRKAIFVGSALRFAQQFTGITAFSVFAHSMFIEAGGNVSANTSVIICTGVLALSTFLASTVLEKLGRRKATFISSIGCKIILVLMGVFAYLKHQMDLSKILWFPVVGMFIFMILYSLGLGIVPTLMMGELFSPNIKGHALAIMTIFFSICMAVTTKVYQELLSDFGLHASFFFFAACTFLSTIVLYFILPETNGKTLEQIQVQLTTNKHKKLTTIYTISEKNGKNMS